MPTRIDVQVYTDDPVFVDADPTGNFFRNIGNIEVKLYNGDAASPTKRALFKTQRQCNHGFIQDRPADVRRGYTEDYGSLSASQFNDSSGDCHITYPDGATGFRIAVRQLPRR